MFVDNTVYANEAVNAVRDLVRQYSDENAFSFWELEDPCLVGIKYFTAFPTTFSGREKVALPMPSKLVFIFRAVNHIVFDGVDEFESQGDINTYNGIAEVDVLTGQFLVEKFVIGQEGDSHVNLLDGHIDPDEFVKLNVEKLNKIEGEPVYWSYKIPSYAEQTGDLSRLKL